MNTRTRASGGEGRYERMRRACGGGGGDGVAEKKDSKGEVEMDEGELIR
jgi:hypothetical protein